MKINQASRVRQPRIPATKNSGLTHPAHQVRFRFPCQSFRQISVVLQQKIQNIVGEAGIARQAQMIGCQKITLDHLIGEINRGDHFRPSNIVRPSYWPTHSTVARLPGGNRQCARLSTRV